MSRNSPLRDELPSGGAPSVTVARNTAYTPAMPLPAEALQAPGVSVIHPASSSARIADQIMGTLNAAGALGAEIEKRDYYANLEARRLANEKRAEEHAAARNAAEDRATLERAQAGQGVGDARVDFPQLAADIRSGKLKVEAGEDPKMAAARVIAAEHQGLNLPEAHTSAYEKTLMPELVGEFVRQQEQKQAEARGIASSKILAGVTGATDPAVLRTAAADLRSIDPQISEPESLMAVGKAAIDFAKASGSRDALAAAEGIVGGPGGLMRTQIEQARSELDARARQERVRSNADAQQALAKMINDGSPVEQVMSVASRMRKLGTLQEDDFGRLRAGFIQQENKLAADKEEKRIRTTAAAEDIAAMTTGMGWKIPDKTESVLVDGRKLELTRAQRVEVATNQILQSAAAANPGDPTRAVNSTIKTFSDNDHLPDQWNRMITSAAGQATVWNVTNDEKATLPTTVTAGLDLYQRLVAAQSPLVYKLPAETRKVFDGIIEAQRHGATDPAQAVMESRRQREMPANPVPQKLIETAASDFISGTRNPGELTDAIREGANYYRRMGVSDDEAATRATAEAKSRYTVINGWAVDTSAATLPDEVRQQLPTIGRVMADWWVYKNPEAAKARDVAASDIALTFSSTTGTWALLDARTGRLLPAQVPTTMEGMVHELQIIRTSNRWSELEKADAEKARISKQQQMDQALQLPAPMRALGHWLEGLGLNTSAPLPAGSMTK